MIPLLTKALVARLEAARAAHQVTLLCSLDLDRSMTEVTLGAQTWRVADQSFPYPQDLKDRTLYYWDGAAFQPVSRFDRSLIKLVPTEWGAPTFEIDGIKMLPTAQLSPVTDAANKVAMIEPRGKVILDCCGGLGYFAVQCLQGGAARIVSFEKNPDVIWLRSLNPWSPEGGGMADARLDLQQGDVSERIAALGNESFNAILHDPPRFGIAGELYSQVFYDHLARVLKRNGRLFHYTGTPNKLTSGRDVPNEVSKRLRNAGFTTEIRGDGVLAVKRASRR
jgi:uncharacterized protein